MVEKYPLNIYNSLHLLELTDQRQISTAYVCSIFVHIIKVKVYKTYIKNTKMMKMNCFNLMGFLLGVMKIFWNETDVGTAQCECTKYH